MEAVFRLFLLRPKTPGAVLVYRRPRAFSRAARSYAPSLGLLNWIAYLCSLLPSRQRGLSRSAHGADYLTLDWPGRAYSSGKRLVTYV